ncbi:GNAT family N-acetyltransferase [Kitasatospora sp. NPDC098652]|uniref:GNAT family N-acetyltransferase n=1 Tax=Kitasatospora sp. NPDC098652 TaxID=3364095 RepID=UPI003803A804
MSHVTNVMISVEMDDVPAVEELSRWLQTAAPKRGFGPGVVGWVGALRETTGRDTTWGGGKYPECEVYAGALNHADLAGLIAHIERIPWQQPDFFQLFVKDQSDLYFRVWMFHGAQLRQLAPEGRDREFEPLRAPSHIDTRFALTGDAELLRELLVSAVNWAPGHGLSPEAVLSDPANSRYVEGWPRHGDLGLVAVASRAAHGDAPVGAAWLRYFTEDEPGYGFVAPDVPELSIGVHAAERGRGVGTVLLRRLLRIARESGVDRVSLSVERANPALRLYEREGFLAHGPREGEGSLTMVADLRSRP